MKIAADSFGFLLSQATISFRQTQTFVSTGLLNQVEASIAPNLFFVFFSYPVNLESFLNRQLIDFFFRQIRITFSEARANQLFAQFIKFEYPFELLWGVIFRRISIYRSRLDEVSDWSYGYNIIFINLSRKCRDCMAAILTRGESFPGNINGQ
jgi:hypothetical protein